MWPEGTWRTGGGAENRIAAPMTGLVRSLPVEAGAAGYLLKDAPAADLVDAVERAARVRLPTSLHAMYAALLLSAPWLGAALGRYAAAVAGSRSTCWR